ncbi:Helix-destabilizing protein [Cesiribacter andamanensis AMV16]|uniref:Single-stranded DNA-binding protein n=1 Tax=Cesiribacter andamanensis AMV16 TaxID=1279009 RepID=M7N0N8_9BACT|nr:Helix-destabilizing protein [Cesiribacter andamanensis AMV16]
MGNLGKDPEVRAMESGRKVANFPLATTETYKDRDGNRQEQTEWHNVVFWGPIVDTIERYLKKGSSIYVEGRIRTRSYQDKDNQTRYITEIMGQQMNMLGGGGGRSDSHGNDMGGHDSGSSQQRSGAQAQQSAPQPTSFNSGGEEDDLPF